jgi:hypothetical protein
MNKTLTINLQVLSRQTSNQLSLTDAVKLGRLIGEVIHIKLDQLPQTIATISQEDLKRTKLPLQNLVTALNERVLPDNHVAFIGDNGLMVSVFSDED